MMIETDFEVGDKVYIIRGATKRMRRQCTSCHGRGIKGRGEYASNCLRCNGQKLEWFYKTIAPTIHVAEIEYIRVEFRRFNKRRTELSQGFNLRYRTVAGTEVVHLLSNGIYRDTRSIEKHALEYCKDIKIKPPKKFKYVN